MASDEQHPKPTQAAQEPNGILQDIIDSLFQQGVNRGVMVVFNVSFLVLILLFASMLFLGGFNIHYFFLLILSIGLFGAIHWFLAELQAARQQQADSPDQKKDQ
eukprot:comp21035_c0_seq1/m.28263 comp21035_c0_seq1/g.28263  ORF comp21035_c0_seq1/g.28263 comp21035_c0_seq1/m.28263 type:complete len:104 (-) comp21035_c0_seq1:621-932(-)